MLLGTEIGAALTALEPYDVDIFGLNCATGPKEMNDAVRYLGLNSPKQISVLPNAGLPQNVGGKPFTSSNRRNWRTTTNISSRLRRSRGGRMLRHHSRSTSRRCRRVREPDAGEAQT